MNCKSSGVPRRVKRWRLACLTRMECISSRRLLVSVQRPRVVETTALGAAYLAGLAVGYWESQDQVAANWCLDRTYTPQMSTDHRNRLYCGWQEAVRRSRGWATEIVT